MAAEDILRAFNEIQAAGGNSGGRIPKFWDGKSAERIAKIIRGKSVRQQVDMGIYQLCHCFANFF